MVKIWKGTPYHHGPSLCVTCRHATIVQGQRLDEEIVSCSRLPEPYTRVRFKVVRCSEYKDKSQPTLNAMQSIAWELRTDKKGQRIGFLSQTEIRTRRAELGDAPYMDDDD